MRFDRTMSRALVAATMLIVPSVAGAQQPTLLSSLSRAAQVAIAATADSLRAEGLPGETVLARAAEGVLKGADEPRILAAVHRLSGELRAGRSALGSGATASEIVAAASALHAGASADMLRRLRDASPADGARGPLTVPLVVLADLVSRGTPVSLAGESVASLLSRRATDADLQALRSSVERDIVAGGDPGKAALARSRALAEALTRSAGARPSTPPPARPLSPRP